MEKITIESDLKKNFELLIEEYTNQGWTATSETHNSIEHKFKAEMIKTDVFELPEKYYQQK